MIDTEKKQQKLNALRCLLNEKEKDFERRKAKRAIITILGFAIFYFWLIFNIEKPVGWYVVLTALAAIFFAGIHFGANAIIFSQLCQKSREEDELIKQIKKSISQIENSKKP